MLGPKNETKCPKVRQASWSPSSHYDARHGGREGDQLACLTLGHFVSFLGPSIVYLKKNLIFVVENRIEGEIEKSPKPFRSLWNGICIEWNYP